MAAHNVTAVVGVVAGADSHGPQVDSEKGVNCKLTGNVCNETVRERTPLTDCEQAETELTVATISNYNQGFLLALLDAGFAVTAPRGDANRITADRSQALHINLLEKGKKTKPELYVFPLCSSHGAGYVKQSIRCCRSRLESNVC